MSFNIDKEKLLQDKKTLKFIEKARKVHGDFYDYSLVIYQKNNVKVKIICPVHGVFEQTPANHLSGFQCMQCSIEKRAKEKTNQAKSNFIEKARKVHGDKYDYSKIDYRTAKAKVKIICPVHGVFEQTPANHLSGFGCNRCGIERVADRQRLGYEAFLSKAVTKFGNKFKFKFTENYKNNTTETTIICPIHGETRSSIASFLCSGHGCAKCGYEITSKKLSNNTQDFLKEARKVHGDFYDYSLVIYQKNNVKVKIICPVHGVFEQTPQKHIAGSGCNKCGVEKMAEKQRFTISELIEKFRKVHTIKYDYSKIVHNGWDNDITIICPTHGEFKQRLSVHLRGGDCVKCQASKGEKAIERWFSVNNINFKQEVSFTSMDFRYQGLGRLRFDFVIHDHNLIIEFDGEQHFKPINFQGSKIDAEVRNAFEKAQINDLYKNEVCRSRGFDLLRIPYWERDNIENILQEAFFGDREFMFETYSYRANINRYENGILSTIKSA